LKSFDDLVSDALNSIQLKPASLHASCEHMVLPTPGGPDMSTALNPLPVVVDLLLLLLVCQFRSQFKSFLALLL
jgi:hypothetical protein